MFKIIFGGDICPMGNVEKLFSAGATVDIFHDLLDDIINADLSVANLECPLIQHADPITKAGPVLGASTECIKGLKSTGWNAANLANNHSFDHGRSGLESTMCALTTAGISFFGAGKNLEEAKLPFVTEINNNRVVLYAMAEHEFSVAKTDIPGSNPFDIISFVEAVKKYKKNDTFIVLVHGGAEFYSFPTPETVRRFRFMIDMGADAVICCHSHCPQPWETYNGKPIIYGLGNLIFEEKQKQRDLWYEGYLAEVTFNQKSISFRPIPCYQKFGVPGVNKMDDERSNIFLAKMLKRSEIINDESKLNSAWTNFCKQKRQRYLSLLFGDNKLKRKISKYLFSTIHSRISIIQSLHLVHCETHKEILDTILSFELKKSIIDI